MADWLIGVTQCIGADKPMESMECTGAVAEDKAVWITSGWTTVSECTHCSLICLNLLLTVACFNTSVLLRFTYLICLINKHAKDYRVQTLSLVDNGLLSTNSKYKMFNHF